MKLTLTLLLLLFTAPLVLAEPPCKNCRERYLYLQPSDPDFRALAMLQNHPATRDPAFFSCQDRQYQDRLKLEENWHLRDKECTELARIFANRAVHQNKLIYTKRLYGVYCGNSIKKGDVVSLKKVTARFKADGDLAYYWRQEKPLDFTACPGNVGFGPLTDLGRTLPKAAEEILEHLVFVEKVDLNLPNGDGTTMMDWTEAVLSREKKGTQGWRLVETIRKAFRDPRLGNRKGRFTCEITGSCYCHEDHTYGHAKNRSCPPSPSMLARLE